MSIRQPTRLLDVSQISDAYPRELLVNFLTGDFSIVKSDGSVIQHKKPGTLTVSYGETKLLDNADLSGSLSFTIPEVSDISGNAATATKLETPVALTIGSTSKNFDGSTALTWSLSDIGAAASDHDHGDTYIKRSGGTLTGNLYGGASVNIGASSMKFGYIYAIHFMGNASSATQLKNPVALTIGSTSKDFDGSTALTWSLSDIGAAASGHDHDGTYLKLIGGTLTGALTTKNITVASGSTLTVSTAGNVTGISVTYTATVGTTWTGSAAPYSQTITVTGIKSTDTPIVDVSFSGTYSTDTAREEAWANIYRITTANNSITVYSHEKTTTTCPIQLVVVR